jgi:hypothetical protein
LLLIIITFRAYPVGPALLHHWKSGTEILDSYVGWSMIVSEFQRHPGSGTSIAAVSFFKEEVTANGQIRQVLFIVTKNSCTNKAVCAGALQW